jgi:hypothetical protein
MDVSVLGDTLYLAGKIAYLFFRGGRVQKKL